MHHEGLITLGILFGLTLVELIWAFRLAQKRYLREISDLKRQLRAYQAHHLPDGERGDASEQALYYWHRVRALERVTKGETQ